MNRNIRFSEKSVKYIEQEQKQESCTFNRAVNNIIERAARDTKQISREAQNQIEFMYKYMRKQEESTGCLGKSVSFDKRTLSIIEDCMKTRNYSFNRAICYLISKADIGAKQLSQRLLSIQEQTNFISQQIRSAEIKPKDSNKPDTTQIVEDNNLFEDDEDLYSSEDEPFEDNESVVEQKNSGDQSINEQNTEKQCNNSSTSNGVHVYVHVVQE